MSEYTDEIENVKEFEANVVLDIGGLFYAKKQPDSGLVVDAEKLVVDRPQIGGVKLDIRKPSTPIGSLTFMLKDDAEDDYATTVEIMKTEGMFLEKEITAYHGFIRGAGDPFDFAQYHEITKTKITKVVKVPNGYSITSKEITHKVNEPALNAESPLTTALVPLSSTLDIVDASLAPFTAGLIKVGSEFMEFTGIVSNTLQNLVRGVRSTDASSHDVGGSVQFVTQFNDVNPIDILLQIMLSDEGTLTNDPTYDVLNGGLAIPPEDIDIVSFTNAKTSFFLNEEFDLVTYGEENILKFLEKEVLDSTGTRLVSVNGKISLAVLDQVDYNATVPEIGENSIIGTPTWSLSSDKVVNEIWVSYDYNEGTRQFETTQVFQDADSIATFGKKKPLKKKYKGIKTSLNGSAIATARGLRLLARLGTARGSVTLKSHLDTSTIAIGKNALVTHRYIPQEGSTLGISQQLEVMTRSIDLDKSMQAIQLDFTSYTGIRIPFIAPAPFIVLVVDQKTFQVPEGGCYKVGDCLRLWDDTIGVDGQGDYLPDADNLIESIDGNELTMLNNWTTVLTTSIRLKLCDYDEANASQKGRYAFIGENTGFFIDGTKSYQIIF